MPARLEAVLSLIAADKALPKSLKFLEKIGAGDANRTRDPNLGKVMLYP